MSSPPAPEERRIVVAAGILRRGDCILACRRRLGDAFGGKWELPGGKLEEGEAPDAALVRELREELDVEISPGPEVDQVIHAYDGHPNVRLHFFEVNTFAGEPQNRAFEEIRWAAPDELAGLDWLEADAELVRRVIARPGRPLRPRRQP